MLTICNHQVFHQVLGAYINIWVSLWTIMEESNRGMPSLLGINLIDYKFEISYYNKQTFKLLYDSYTLEAIDSVN